MEEVLSLPEEINSSTDCILLLLVTVFMPGETFFIESYDNLWALVIGILCKHKIGLIRVFPAGEKKQVVIKTHFKLSISHNRYMMFSRMRTAIIDCIQIVTENWKAVFNKLKMHPRMIWDTPAVICYKNTFPSASDSGCSDKT